MVKSAVVLANDQHLITYTGLGSSAYYIFKYTQWHIKLMKLSVSILPENKYFALKPRSPWEASVWKWTQSSGAKTTMGILGMVCPQNLANSSPSESPEGGGKKV